MAQLADRAGRASIGGRARGVKLCLRRSATWAGARRALGARLHLRWPMQAGQAAGGSVRGVFHRFHDAAQFAPAGALARRCRLRIAPTWGRLPGPVACRVGRSYTITTPARRAGISRLLAIAGPGRSAGETIQPLPDVWLNQAWPADYIGQQLAALAVLRGESWAADEAGLTVGGRVVITEAGANMLFDGDDAAAAWLDVQVGALAGALGLIWLAPGALRERLISAHRARIASGVMRRARLAYRIADGPRRAALVADLDWMQRRV